jgi:pimeloyl-ACP methyl ester carboxylesterase
VTEGPAPATPDYPYAPRFLRVNGRRMHYVDETGPGAPAPGAPGAVLLLHGNPTWGYLWRDVIPPLLRAGHRVVVPDQIGFGRSEKPHESAAHTLDNHAANVVALLDALDLNRVLLVCHDWGGPTGLAAAATRPDRIAAVAVMSTWAWATPASPFHRAVTPWRFMHAPLVGPYVLGRHGAMPGRGMYLSVVDRARFAHDAQPVYEQALPDPGDRALTWQWPRSIPIGRESDTTTERFAWLEAQVAAMRLPSTIIWGREDDVFDPELFAARWHELWPHAEGTHLVTGRHFLQEDSGERIGEILAEFAERSLR